jgi:hypothetical protein
MSWSHPRCRALVAAFVTAAMTAPAAAFVTTASRHRHEENFMHRIWSRLRARVLGAAALLILATSTTHASYVLGSINSGADGVACGAVNEPFLLCPAYTGPVGLDIGSAKVLTDFGMSRVLASAGAQAASEWMIRYALTGVEAGATVELKVEIGFDLNIAAATNSESEFRMVVNNETLFPFIIRIATDGLGNRCDHLSSAAECVSGDHSGVWTKSIEALVSPNNLFYLFVGAGNFGGGWVDAFNTVHVNRIIVPDGIGWAYADGLQGNPLNFVNASDVDPGTVPEPPVAALAGLALVCAALSSGARRRRRSTTTPRS